MSQIRAEILGRRLGRESLEEGASGSPRISLREAMQACRFGELICTAWIAEAPQTGREAGRLPAPVDT